MIVWTLSFAIIYILRSVPSLESYVWIRLHEGMCMYEAGSFLPPPQRPTAGELLRHKFLRQARKTSYLCELVERFVRWRAEEGEELSTTSSYNSIE